MSAFYIRLAGLVFVLLGAAWVGVGLYVEETIIWFAGGLTAGAGVALAGAARRLGSRDTE